MQQVINHLQSEGFNISEFIPDGKVHRFAIDESDKRKSGFYIGFQNFVQSTGEKYYFVQYGSWRSSEIKSFSTLLNVSAADRKLQKEQMARASKEFELRQMETWNETAIEVEAKWMLLSDSGTSEYLNRKKVTAVGVKFDNFNGDIYVPARDLSGKLWSLQRITYSGDKRFHPGGRINGCCHVLGDVSQSDLIYIAEGYATSCSVHMATEKPVICAFSAQAITPILGEWKKKYPEKKFVIAGDNDENRVGNEAAERGGKKWFCPVVIPKTTGDWNDVHCQIGLEEVATQLDAGVPEDEPLTKEYIQDFPYPDEDEKGRRKCTIENVSELLRRLKIVARYNIISKEEEFIIPGLQSTIDNRENVTLAHIGSWCERCRIPTDKLGQILTAVADSNTYNPVAAWIESEPWDGVSRLPDLAETLKSKTEMKDLLLRKWLISAVAAAYEPNGVSAHGVFVIQGDQYIGKTKWFKNLAPAELIYDGAILHPDNKDSVFQIVSKWLVELGEIDATFRKSDISQLKAFLTKDNDTLRRPYARKDSHYARRTVFFASVNEPDFLNDPTGNRRFWTVECESIDYDHGINMQQLWAEVRHIYLSGESWYLTHHEMIRLNAHNETFEKKEPLEEMLRLKFDWAGTPRDQWKWFSATSICQYLGIETPQQKDTRAVARAIRKITGHHCKDRGKGGVRILPLPNEIFYEHDKAPKDEREYPRLAIERE